MKKLIAALALICFLIFFAASALGQSVGASQIKKKANAGIVADSANALALGIYRGTSAPASPVTGQAWLDTTVTPAILKTYNGSAWEITPTGAGITQADLTSFPASPSDGQIVWVQSLKRAIIYSASDATWYYLDGVNRPAQSDYSLATAGFSSSFIAAPGATSGTIVAGGSMTTGTHLCAISVYSSTGGETMIGADTGTLTVATNRTASLTFGAGGAGVAGKRVWCTKANATNPFWLVATIDDNTTTTYSVTVADTSFSLHTAPDVDFSAPIPAGWSYFNNNHAKGGCGSTGTSLLCAAYLFDAVAVGAVGPRLMYGITGSSNDWTATMTISRMAKGFPGAAASSANILMGAASTGNSVVSEVQSVGLQNNGPSWPVWGTAYRYDRNSTTQWSGASNIETLRLPTGPPFDLRASSYGGPSVWYGRVSVSPNGRDWNDSLNMTSTTEWRHFGMVLECVSGGSGLGAVIEITDLTFKSY